VKKNSFLERDRSPSHKFVRVIHSAEANLF